MEVLNIVGVDKAIVLAALSSDFKDMEDAIQEYASAQNNIEVIITRNINDFKQSNLKILTPSQFLVSVEKNE